MAQKTLRIYFHVMDGTGHLNACIGLAQALQKRGHSIVFLLNAAFKGQYSQFGFKEHLLERSPEAEGPPLPENVNPIKFFAKMILEAGMFNGKSPLEKLKEMQEKKDTKLLEKMFEASVDFNPQIQKVLEQEKPDLVILDHFLLPPSIVTSGIPWLALFSGNPLAIFNSPDLPPFTSGYLVNDQTLWEEFRAQGNFMVDTLVEFQKKLYKEFDYEPTPEDLPQPGFMFPNCPYGYIYGYPEELDYQDVITIPAKFIRVDAFCRETPEPFELPEGFQVKGEKLIYFSLGSLASADVELVKKVTKVLAKTPYKTLVSKGPLADEYELPENCWGEGYLPQTKILPLVDLVITHGGNNTVTETFSFGKPMIVLPLFADQYDNAQRIQEKGYGIRLEPYNFEEHQLLDAVHKLINDKELKERLQMAEKRIEVSNSKEKACKRIEDLVAKYSN